ncbi:hypothetical protein D9615_007414 [Tricholomella constricta]|uniref:Uncharacterized protein n=1 Tax=Tricholomella constricta TaxID=117010 RepID=A0A8H5GYN3_9AGAR|nr:hypothetical protein D9615_007414 [Tricholomella constricta]
MSAVTTAEPTPPQTLYLRVNRKFLFLFPAATQQQPNPQPSAPLPGTTGNLNVIVAQLPALRPFAGDTVDWLIKVARFIFEPLGTSSLYTFTTKTVEWWLNREMEPSLWRQVGFGEQLEATIYEFRLDNDALVALTRISLRPTRSVTTQTSAPRANMFRDTLLRRHQRCIITQSPIPSLLVASHLIPRRLGDAGVHATVERFTGDSNVLDRYDPIIGVPLLATLDLLVDTYHLGFWNTGPDQYVVHSFVDTPLHLYGGPPLTSNDPMCHGRQLTLSIHDPSLSLPPVGVFNWHYVQCVLKKFSSSDYQQIDNIQHFVMPFRTRDDDDDGDVDFDDEGNVTNPPYPSYLWELSEARERRRLDAIERNRAIMAWNSGVSST